MFEKFNQDWENLVQNLSATNLQENRQLGQIGKPIAEQNQSTQQKNPSTDRFADPESSLRQQREQEQFPTEPNHHHFPSGFEFANVRNKYLPISKWGFKFTGDGSGMHLLDFLQTVEIYMNLEKKTKQEVLNSAFHLFSGRAKTWYMTWRHTFGTYEYLIDRLKANFLSADHDLVLRHEIEQREQRPNEPFIQFLTDVEYKCQQLSRSLSEQEKLFIIRRNLNSFYSSRLGAMDITSIEHLVRLCDRVDTFSRSSRTSNMANSTANRNQLAANNFQRNSNRTFRVNEVVDGQDNETEIAVPTEEAEEETVNVVRTVTRLPFKNSTASQADSRNTNQAQSSSNPQGSSLVNRNHSQPQDFQNQKSIQCFNCKKFGHKFSHCRTPQTSIFCYRCGQDNVYSFECPCASGNGQ
jgi:hypothetical protein